MELLPISYILIKIVELYEILIINRTIVASKIVRIDNA